MQEWLSDMHKARELSGSHASSARLHPALRVAFTTVDEKPRHPNCLQVHVTHAPVCPVGELL